MTREDELLFFSFGGRGGELWGAATEVGGLQQSKGGGGQQSKLGGTGGRGRMGSFVGRGSP